jgi:hypothetical protein
MTDGVERSRKSAYEQIYSYIKQKTVGNPALPYAVAETTLKTSLCANGSLDPEQVDTALKALGEQDKIQYANGWITPVVDLQYHRDAVAWLAQKENPPKELIGAMNKAMQDFEWP